MKDKFNTWNRLKCKVKNGSYYFTFNRKNGKQNTAMLNQMKTFDAKRVVSYAGKISNNIYKNLVIKLDDFLGITLIKNEGVPTRAKYGEIVPQNIKNVNSNKIFITGGAGYIGTHTCIELLENGYDLVVYDNLSNSSKEAIKRVEKITNKKINFIEGDIRDKEKLYLSMKGCEAVNIASCYAHNKKATKLLNWKAKYNINDMCQDSWNWQNKNPKGYDRDE
jgi:poly-gamma-glutamate capsule biosynthesis protein CapA/YwtB (metallophosphatase superfamily)